MLAGKLKEKNMNFFTTLKSVTKGVGSGVGSDSGIGQWFTLKCHGSPTLSKGSGMI